MALHLLLEEFSQSDQASQPSAPRHHAEPDAAAAAPGAASSPEPAITADMLEKTRLESYEAGYKAGWDDATRAEADEQGRIGAEFARNLQDLGFTFHEARAHVMQALEPLLAGMVERVLPRLVSETMGQTILEELLPLATEAADTPIEVVVAPQSRAVLDSLLTGATTVPFALIEESTLAPGQVFLRSGKTERHIDFATAIDRIGTAIEGLYDLNEKAFRNG